MHTNKNQTNWLRQTDSYLGKTSDCLKSTAAARGAGIEPYDAASDAPKS